MIERAVRKSGDGLTGLPDSRFRGNGTSEKKYNSPILLFYSY